MIWRVEVSGDPSAANQNVIVDGHPATSTADLAQRLDEIGLKGPYYLNGRDVRESETLAKLELKDGDEISAGRSSPQDRQVPSVQHVDHD